MNIFSSERHMILPSPLEKQPAPHGKGKPILGMVLADLTNRALEGKLKYGEPLKAHNGRDALQDLYEELLDAAMYIKQAMVERDS